MKKWCIIGILLLLVLTCSSCRHREQEEVIVSSFYPITYLIKEMVPDNITVYTIVKEHQEPHDYTLNVEDMKAISSSKLIETLGLGLEAWCESLDKNQYNIHSCSQDISLIDNNIHIWLDVNRYIQMAQHIYQDIIDVFNEYTLEISLNYNHLINDLRELDQELEILSLNITDTIVTLHNAYVYMAERYHFKTVALEDSEELTVNSLKNALDYIKNNNIERIYYSPLDNTVLMNNIKSNYALEYMLCDNYESTYEDYIKIMRNNMKRLGGDYE